MKQYRPHYPILILALVVWTAGAFGQNRASDLVHYGDLIEVDVVGSYDYDWRGSVTPEGFLDGLDTLENQIYALCRSEDDLAATIQQE